MAQCRAVGAHGSVQVTQRDVAWLSAGDPGTCAVAQLREGDVQPWLSAGCGGQGTCKVAQCKGGVTRTMTRHVGCVARAGAGTEPPGCTWHLSWPCCGHCSPWGAVWGLCGSTTAWPPVLHRDDVVESTTSRPLHTVGTYGEAEPAQEGSSQGWVGVWQQHCPASHGSGAQGVGVVDAQDGHVPPGAQRGYIPWS